MAKTQGGAPPRTSMRGKQLGTRLTGRSGTKHRTNRGQKQQSQWQNEHEASHEFERANIRGPVRTRERWQPSETPGGGRSHEMSAQEFGRQRGTVTGRPRKLNHPYRSDFEEDRRTYTRSGAQREPYASEQEYRRAERPRAPDYGGQERFSEDHPSRGRGRERLGAGGAHRGMQSGIHAESRIGQEAEGTWDHRPRAIPGRMMAGMREEQPPFRTEPERRRFAEDLDYARRNTPMRDDERQGWGRSAGHGQGRLSEIDPYGADDEDLDYGRESELRNRVPGAGSRRNR